ncbi:MAG: hypothetical protein JSR82_06560 [Verrucomicrobia bacterium]|nr:hypothetical protein [Verrucomicrobiota bacterium]
MPWFALALGLGLAALEWRRPRPGARLARCAAVLLAAVALALLARPRALPESKVTAASLWTAGAAEARGGPGPHFALPDATVRPAEALVVPDIGALRRLHPRLRTLHLHGAGFTSAEAGRLRGLQLVHHPPPDTPAPPGFRALEASLPALVGQPFELRGQAHGPGAELRVQLEFPGAPAQSVAVGPAGRFELRTPPLAAAGRLLASLVLLDGTRELAREPLGIPVVAPLLPRVLALTQAPQLDLARLQAWYAELGGEFALQTLLSRQRTRASAVGGAAADFAELNASVLDGFDVVLLDPARLAALAGAERAALDAAVRERGLGLLLLGPASAAEALAPWKTEPLPPVETGPAERLVRPRWADRALAGQTPLPAWPLQLSLAPAQRPLLTDVQDRPLAAMQAHGRGRLGLTLVRETWRWPQANEPAAFADYWSGVLQRLARPRPMPPHWAVEGLPAVGQPVVLTWHGVDSTPPRAPRVESPVDAPAIELAPAQDQQDPTRWTSVYWPAAEGWHRVTAGEHAVARDFHVTAPSSWSGVRALQRLDTTRQLAAASSDSAAAIPAEPASRAVPTGWLIALLFSALSFLWIEARLARE